MKFSQAHEHLELGMSLYRNGWNGIEAGVDMFVYKCKGAVIKTPEDKEVVLEPFYIFYHGNKKTHDFWVPSIWDLMADDWQSRNIVEAQ